MYTVDSELSIGHRYSFCKQINKRTQTSIDGKQVLLLLTRDVSINAPGNQGLQQSGSRTAINLVNCEIHMDHRQWS